MNEEMIWLPYDEGVEHLREVYFLAKFGKTTHYCMHGEEGDVFVLNIQSSTNNDKGDSISWILMNEPDQILIYKKDFK